MNASIKEKEYHEAEENMVENHLKPKWEQKQSENY